MKFTKNIIALQKGFVCPPNDGIDNRIAVATVQSHLMQWGYMLDQDAFDQLAKADLSFIEIFHNEAITHLRSIMGGNHNYKPLYKNFPEEVMSKSDFELYINAIMHYWSNGNWEPSTSQYEKPIKFENIKYTIIKYGTQERFSQIFTDLVGINTSLTHSDLEIVRWFVNSGLELKFPDVIPFKENLCTLAAMSVPGLPVKTPTDVLRIAINLSGGDISLPKVPIAKVRQRGYRYSTVMVNNPEREKFKFKKFNRKERKYLLGLLEQTSCDPREMILKDQRWIRLGEILHPLEYKNLYPKVATAFNKIRNEKVRSWYALVDQAFSKDLESGLKLLSQRPGEFSRRLDWLIRKNPKQVNLVMQYFGEAVKTTSNKVLFEVYTHFENRLEEKSNRSIMVKGSRKRTVLPTLPALPKPIVETVHSKLFESLKSKFSKLPKLGNCWIDEELKKIPLPTNMRSMNFSAKPVLRGQRVPLDNPNAKVIRPFVHWMDKNGSEDLDLSVTFVGDKVNEVLSFSNLTIGKSVHSGDVRHRRGACAEYVDIHMADALSRGFKYVIIDVRNFNGRPLKTVDTVFGIMEREHPESNKIWLPETISNCQGLESTSVGTLISVIDLKTKEYIMLDIDSESITARHDTNTVLKTLSQYVNLPKLSVYDLVLMHAEARGRQVTLDSNVDTYFKFEDYCYSYESTGKLMGV